MRNKVLLVTAVVCLAAGVCWGTLSFVATAVSTSNVPMAAAGDSQTLVTEGKNLLTDHNILAARDKFAEAAAADPTNQEAQLLYGITRVFAVYEEGQSLNTDGLDSVREILDLSGFIFSSFNLYYTEGTAPQYGPANTMPETGAIFDFLKTKLLTEVDNAITNVAAVTDQSFSSTITPAAVGKTTGSSINIDYADVQVVKSLLYALKCQIELLQVYGLNVHIPTLAGADGQQLMTYKNLFQGDPSLLAIKDASRLDSAKNALIGFIDTYNAAAGLIPNRPQQDGHLFVVDVEITDSPISASSSGLHDIMDALAEIKASLNGPQLFSFVEGKDRNRYIDLSKFFNSSQPIDFRAKIADNATDTVFPDHTFGGLFPMGVDGLERHAAQYKPDILGVLFSDHSTPFAEISPESAFLSEPSPDVYIYIKNYGTAPLTVDSIALQGPDYSDFELIQDTCPSFPSTLQPSTECRLRVRFNPASPGFKSADLLVQSNDPNSPRLYSHIWGYKDGVPPPPTPVTEYPFTYTRAGTGTGTIYNSTGDSSAESFSISIPDGYETVLLPAAGKFSRFMGWSGCDSLTDDNGCRVTMHSAKSITATFNLDTTSLNIAAAPAGGAYAVLPVVSLVANKDADVYYTLDGTDPTDSSALYTGPIQLSGTTTLKYRGVDANGMNPVMTDIYDMQSQSVTVTISGTGSGSVNSVPGGISGSGSAAFDWGSSVTLTATKSAGSDFFGWSGACTGTGDCVLTMDGPKSVNARFDVLPYVKIFGTSVYYGTLQAAFGAGSGGSILQARNITFTENLLLTNPVSMSFVGGYPEGFGPPTGLTVLDGQLIIGTGSLNVDRLAIR